MKRRALMILKRAARFVLAAIIEKVSKGDKLSGK